MPESELGAGEALAVSLLLALLDLSQHRPQALVGDDVGLADAPLWVDEHAAGEKLPLVAELDPSYGPFSPIFPGELSLRALSDLENPLVSPIR